MSLRFGFAFGRDDASNILREAVQNACIVRQAVGRAIDGQVGAKLKEEAAQVRSPVRYGAATRKAFGTNGVESTCGSSVRYTVRIPGNCSSTNCRVRKSKL